MAAIIAISRYNVSKYLRNKKLCQCLLTNKGYGGEINITILRRGTGKAAKMMQNPAAERNKGPILEVLKKYLPRDFRGKAMDMSAGIGVHVACFASYFASIEWLPTEFDRGLFNSIRAKVAQHKLQNVLDPRMVDTREPVQAWAEGTLQQSCFDVIISVNVIHISPWTATEGLFAGAGQLLRPGGYLFTYGPYSENGVIFPESNVRFDQSLKLKDPDWGIRDISRVQIVAENNGLSLLDKVDCPANNKVLVFQKAGHLNI